MHAEDGHACMHAGPIIDVPLPCDQSQASSHAPPQAERWGAELYTEDVQSIDLSTRPFTITSTDRVVCVPMHASKTVPHACPRLHPHPQMKAHTIILAMGATALRLGLPSEKSFWSKGISACAICDGAMPVSRPAGRWSYVHPCVALQLGWCY